MRYTEETKNLFSVPEDYYLAHCISADFGMGAGIVVEFNRRFNMKSKLQDKYPYYLTEFSDKGLEGDCILEDRVLNLITKRRVYEKPTINSMTVALKKMKEICKREGISKMAMPTIGAGLDRLNWEDVSRQIMRVFCDTDIEVLVCKLK